MCGRYYYVFDEQQRKYIEEISGSFTLENFAQEEIFPSMQALLFIQENKTIKACVRKWGITGFDGKLIINARSETCKEKKMFASMQRCVIPCNGFYEWKVFKQRKDKIYIQKRNTSHMYLAGLYVEENFVILTGQAQLQMKKVHSRTPLILNEEEMKAYLLEGKEAMVNNEELIFSLCEK